MKTLLLALLPAALMAGQYPMESGDLQRSATRQSPSSIRGPLQEQWTAVAGPKRMTWPGPLVTDDSVIMASSYQVTSWDRSNGARRWTANIPLSYGNGSLDKARGLVYFGGMYGSNYSDSLTALRTSDGSIAWSWRGNAANSFQSSASPALLPEGLVFAGGQGNLVSVDPDTHAETWQRALGGAIRTFAYDNGRIYAATSNGTLACIQASDGSVVWSKKSSNQYSSAVTLGPDYFYVMVNVGRIEAHRRSDGVLAWSYSTASFSNSNMALCAGVLVAASDDRQVYAFDAATGAKLWSLPFAGNFAHSAPIIVCGVVFISGCAGSYYGVDLRTGTKMWNHFHNAFNSFVDWAVEGDQAFVMDADGVLHAFKALEPEDPSTCSCLIQPTATPSVQPSPVPGPCQQPGDPRLALWLDAKDAQTDASGGVIFWPDRSGHRHHANGNVVTQPRLLAPDASGGRSVDFTWGGIDRYLNINRSSEAWVEDYLNFTVLMVAKPLAGGNSEQYILGASQWNTLDRFNVGLRNGSWAVNGWYSNVPVAFGKKVLLAYRSTASGQDLRLDGVTVGAEAPAFQSRTGTNLTLGNICENPGTFYKGELQTVMVFNGALSDEELQRWEDCLLGKTPTPTMTVTVTPTRTDSETPTATPTATPTRTPSASPAATATASATVSATPTVSPSSTATPTAATTVFVPKATDTPLPAVDCGASIDRIQVSPNPQTGCAMADRMVSVKLGCSADEVIIEVYGRSGALLFRWVETDKHVQKGQWVHSRYPHEVDLPNGVYYVKVTVKKGQTEAHASTTFMVLK